MSYKQLESIGKAEKVPEFITQVKRGEQRLFGYGHRVYKIEDPRLRPVRQMIHELSQNVEHNHLLLVAMQIDSIASQDEYFRTRQLNVNADLYGCFVYTAL